ncbi:glycosyltransferase family 4 protein [Marinobacter oulmenensis]|uniref:Phosphatidylinositol alpha-1,6-mannosyltransferase n=1 Tax=Marinobacter oulmenensis TaxID=643747 RepID=A0A840U6E5_9GAMM|nr:glycosyltransferase family 4 protein [Marinobacter oulmenensis]MBB5320699.1 phosphatidylinositol alpha-1,6-mannosyltransferase [Marinobacter oulmenensis]
MSILLISEIFPPRHGGSGRWFHELYRRLPEQSVTIITGINDTGRDNELDAGFPQVIRRINLSSRHWGLLNLAGLLFYLRTLWRVFRLRPKDLAQIHCGRAIPEGFIGLILARLLGKPLVCYVHGEDIEVARTSRELTWIVRRVLGGAERLVCNSLNTQSLLTDYWQVPRERIRVLNPGVDEQTFIPVAADTGFRQRSGWQGRFVCLTVGRLQRRKGHDRMIEAIPELIREVPDFLYAIVGQGDTYPELQATVERLSLQEHVQFLQDIDDSDLVKCYQQCDLFILPNRTDGNDIEGFGMVLVEAQACGKPVIAGDSGGTSETMVQGQTGLIADCTDPLTIARAVSTMQRDMERGAFQPDACRLHVLDNFTWSSHTRKAQELFRELGGVS